MAGAPIYRLLDRGVIAVTSTDAHSWLDNLVSADLTALDRVPVMLSGLLSPQGKVLFEFFVYKSADGLLLETTQAVLDAFIKRLKLYKLRAQIDVTDVTADWAVVWGTGTVPPGIENAIAGPDPRAVGELWRSLCQPQSANYAADGPYLATRVRLDVAEAPHDYALGDIFPHEANYDRTSGASFSKGCYVGQEVVSRMQNKTVVRKRVVRISAAGPLTSGSGITTGAAVIGTIGSAAGNQALALLRLDRVAEAIDKGATIDCGGQSVTIDALALARYRQSVKDRPVIDL